MTSYNFNNAFALSFFPYFCFVFSGKSKKAPAKDYSVTADGLNRIFGTFNAISIIATTYGNGIIPEIQVLKFHFVSLTRGIACKQVEST